MGKCIILHQDISPFQRALFLKLVWDTILTRTITNISGCINASKQNFFKRFCECAYTFVPVRLCVQVPAKSRIRWVSDALEIVSCLMWVLGSISSPLQEQPAFYHSSIPLALIHCMDWGMGQYITEMLLSFGFCMCTLLGCLDDKIGATHTRHLVLFDY